MNQDFLPIPAQLLELKSAQVRSFIRGGGGYISLIIGFTDKAEYIDSMAHLSGQNMKPYNKSSWHDEKLRAHLEFIPQRVEPRSDKPRTFSIGNTPIPPRLKVQAKIRPTKVEISHLDSWKSRAANQGKD